MNVLCLVALAITFLELVSIYFIQGSGGRNSSGNMEARLQDNDSESEDITREEKTTHSEGIMRTEQAKEMELSVEEQIDVFVKEIEQWSNNGDQTIWFTVADINMDNQVELITDSIQGTGVRGTPTSFRYSLCGLWIEDGMVKEEYLGSRQHDTEDVYGEWTVTYEDAAGSVITEEAFNVLAEKKYSQLQEMQMIWKWQAVPLEELQGMTDDEVKELLVGIYNNFTIRQTSIE